VYNVTISASPDGTVIARVCGWCQPRQIPYLLRPELKGIPLTHGMCPDCAQKAAADYAKETGVVLRIN
jgi:hypothetical protein